MTVVIVDSVSIASLISFSPLAFGTTASSSFGENQKKKPKTKIRKFVNSINS